MTTEQRLPLSVCMIAGAEAQRIRRALDSVSGWAGEIIVVINDDVTDGTDQIAELAGAKVFREPWKGYGPQKNSAADKTTQPWLLNLDADEEVTPALRDEIRRTLLKPGGYMAFCFPRCTKFCGRWIRHGDWYPDRQTRLWRRGRARWSDVQVHEALETEGIVGRLHADLLHYSNPTITSYLQKIPNFADLQLKRQLAEGERWQAPAAIIRSLWRFHRAYIFKFGFLDGYPGFFIAFSTAYATLFRYTRLYEHQQQSSPPCPTPDSR